MPFGKSVLMVGGYLAAPDNVHVDAIYELDLTSKDWVLRSERLRGIRSNAVFYETDLAQVATFDCHFYFSSYCTDSTAKIGS